MLIAQEKKKENLPEYILYMWQIEDFIRACEFDMQKIKKQRINLYTIEESTKEEMFQWYENLMVMMQKEQIMEKGHLQILQNNVNELTELHFALLHKKNDPKYRQLFINAAQGLLEIRQRSKVDDNTGDIEVTFIAMYGILMLRLSQKEINKETLQAVKPISKLLAYLGKCYNEEEDKLLQTN